MNFFFKEKRWSQNPTSRLHFSFTYRHGKCNWDSSWCKVRSSFKGIRLYWSWWKDCQTHNKIMSLTPRFLLLGSNFLQKCCHSWTGRPTGTLVGCFGNKSWKVLLCSVLSLRLLHIRTLWLISVVWSSWTGLCSERLRCWHMDRGKP